jgi:hypothetical protein
MLHPESEKNIFSSKIEEQTRKLSTFLQKLCFSEKTTPS